MFSTGKFAGRTAFITGASRGIGKEIALKLAKDGANIVIAAKTAEAHPKLPGTIYTAAAEIEKAGGKCLPCIVDVRDEQAVQNAVEEAVKKFGGIDILVNNASAISLTGTLETPMKRYDLMHQINTRGTYLVSQKCIPYLKRGTNPHILNISPPLLMETQWFSRHVAYTMAKYGMSMCVLGMHEELRPDRIAVNALWPRTAIWTAAMEMLAGEDSASGSRKPAIMADAAYAMLSRDSGNFTGNFCIDDDVLKEVGVTDFDQYAIDPKAPLTPDFFVPGVEYPGGFSTTGSSTRQKSRKAVQGGSGNVEQIFKTLQNLLSADLVAKIGAIYEFQLTGDKAGQFYVDLKNGSGSAGVGAPSEKADVSFSMNSDDFAKMFKGELKATQAFMSGKLKIKGDMGKAMKLEGLMSQFKKSKL